MSRTMQGVLALMLIGLSAGLVGFVGDVTQVTEPQIESAIRARLATDTRIDAKHIQVKAEQGVVTLSGTVPDLESKVLAEALVSGTMVGVRQLHNEITVVRAASTVQSTDHTSLSRTHRHSDQATRMLFIEPFTQLFFTDSSVTARPGPGFAVASSGGGLYTAEAEVIFVNPDLPSESGHYVLVSSEDGRPESFRSRICSRSSGHLGQTGI